MGQTVPIGETKPNGTKYTTRRFDDLPELAKGSEKVPKKGTEIGGGPPAAQKPERWLGRVRLRLN